MLDLSSSIVSPELCTEVAAYSRKGLGQCIMTDGSQSIAIPWHSHGLSNWGSLRACDRMFLLALSFFPSSFHLLSTFFPPSFHLLSIFFTRIFFSNPRPSRAKPFYTRQTFGVFFVIKAIIKWKNVFWGMELFRVIPRTYSQSPFWQRNIQGSSNLSTSKPAEY